MMLWILRPKSGNELWEPWCDKAFGFVVRAETEDEARRLAQSEAGDEAGGWRRDAEAWTDPVNSTCVPLEGEGRPKVIITDFRAA